jgi:Domain of unknown function (DUF4349)
LSQRDLLAELRSVSLDAPEAVRERVRLIAGTTEPRRPRLVTRRRVLLVAVPVAAAVAAVIVVTRPAGTSPPTPARLGIQPQFGAHGAPSAAAVPSTTSTATLAPKAAPNSAAGAATSPIVPAPSSKRLQRYEASLSLRLASGEAVSNAVRRSLAITSSLGGYPLAVHASTAGRHATADLRLHIPRTHVERAITELSALGTITAEQVDLQDLQAGVNATDRTIARLQRELAQLRRETPSRSVEARIATVTGRVQSLQRAEQATKQGAHYATVDLSLSTPAPPAPVHHRHGPLHGVAVALRWAGIGAVYALALGAPAALLLLLVWLAVRAIRRRREAALLSRP